MRMMGPEFASHIWTKLNLYFTAQTRATISKFKTMLQIIKKGSLNTNECLLKVKNAVDRLASVGHTILDSDHVEAIFICIA